ncbi:S-layer homology domain-containing protein [Paenibacillus sp. FA6]|uniref:S-layer homology domain-containing protein n=1 Tax=Paenibacillus sp. FA6 TaxID=3413029 RepID=UPI003F658C7F
MKKWISGLVSLFVFFSFALFNLGTVSGKGLQQLGTVKNSYSDIKEHWAEQSINEFASKGLINGYEDGSFKPNRSISRVEFITIINKLFGFIETEKVTYRDVGSDQWFASEIGKAKKVGYISGYSDETFRPNNPISREEAAVIIKRILALEDPSVSVLFSDVQNESLWSLGAIQLVSEAGIMTGYSDGTFRPLEPLTRAESVALLGKAYSKGTINYDKAGVYGGSVTGIKQIKGNVIINNTNIVLQNVEIAGNLLLGEGIGEGDVTLKNVKVHGITTIKGGGENSIHFEDSVMVTVVVDKVNGSVRIVVNGATLVTDIVIQSNTTIIAESGSEINSVSIAKELPVNSRVNLVGTFETVNMYAQNIVLEIPQGTVNNLNIDKTATGNSINLGKEASIISLILNAAVTVLGEGSITKSTINAEGISIGKSSHNGSDSNSSGNQNTSNSGGGSTDNNGGDNGGSGSGNGGITPLPTGQIPIIKIDRSQFPLTVSDNVYAISDQDGWIYIVENGTTRIDIILDAAVKDGKGVKRKVNANEGVYIDATGLSNTKVDFLVMAMNEDKQVSFAEYIQLYADEADELLYSTTTYGAHTNKSISLHFNKEIENNLSDMNILKNAITYSANGGQFSPLSDEDEVIISGNKIEILFAVPYTGSNNVLKLASGSVKDKLGSVFLKEITTFPIKAAPMVTKVSEKSMFTVGEDIISQVNMATTIYLVKTYPYNTLVDVENEVVAKRGVKVIVDSSQIGQDINIPTKDLELGRYIILVWPGNSIGVSIEKEIPIN